MKIAIRSRKRGSIAPLAFIGMLPLLVAIGCFAVDTMHYNSSRAELQKACDASALAGAQLTWKYDIPTPGAGQAAAEQAANQVIGMNPVDGRGISDGEDSGNTTVDVTFPAATGKPGMYNCMVVTNMNIRGIFSKIIGNWSQRVTARALAGPSAASNVMISPFPLAVSISQNDLNGKKLSQYTAPGTDILWLDWNTSLSWTAFTSHNAHDVGEVMDYWIDPVANASKKGPPVKLGDVIDNSNGTQAVNIQKIHDNFLNKTVVLPIVNGNNQHGSANLPVVGYLGLIITEVNVNGANSYIKGKVTKALLHGSGDPSDYSGFGLSSGDQTWLKTNENYSIKLLSNQIDI